MNIHIIPPIFQCPVTLSSPVWCVKFSKVSHQNRIYSALPEYIMTHSQTPQNGEILSPIQTSPLKLKIGITNCLVNISIWMWNILFQHSTSKTHLLGSHPPEPILLMVFLISIKGSSIFSLLRHVSLLPSSPFCHLSPLLSFFFLFSPCPISNPLANAIFSIIKMYTESDLFSLAHH